MIANYHTHTSLCRHADGLDEEYVQKAIADAPKGRIMIGAECTVSSAPIENIYTAVYTAHHANQE